MQQGREGIVTAAAFAPSRDILAVASCPTAVQLYNVEHCQPAVSIRHASAALPLSIRDAPGGITGITFNPDAKVLSSLF